MSLLLEPNIMYDIMKGQVDVRYYYSKSNVLLALQ
jgi:hypothetical protein